MILITVLLVLALLLFPLVAQYTVVADDTPTTPVPEPAPTTIISDAEAPDVLEEVGVWVQIDPLDGFDPDALSFYGGEVTYLSSGSEMGTFPYELEDDGVITVDQSDGIYFCEQLELQQVEIDGQTVPIVSLYMMEYDGRGLIIVDEFAPADRVDLFPEDYLSEKAQETRNRESSSMMQLGY